jgi:hypothetical protein
MISAGGAAGQRIFNYGAEYHPQSIAVGKNIFDKRFVSYSLANLLAPFGVRTALVAPPATYEVDVSLKL